MFGVLVLGVRLLGIEVRVPVVMDLEFGVLEFSGLGSIVRLFNVR